MAFYDILNLDELTELAVSLAQTLIPDMSFTQGSDNWKRLRAVAGIGNDTNGLQLAVFRQIMVHTSTLEGCKDWARALGVPFQTAIGSSGTDIARITGTAGSSYSAGQTLHPKFNTALSFQLGESGTIPAAGYVDVDISAISTGLQTNLAAGEILVLDSPSPGVNADVELQADLGGGKDDEGVGTLRARVLRRLGDPAKGGARPDYEQWALQQAGIVEAYVYRHRNGLSTIDVAAFREGAGSARSLTSGERTSLLALIDGKRPYPCTVRVLETEADPVAIKVTVTPMAGEAYARDWDDTTPLVVSVWNGATRQLTFTTARPADMAVGDRICWDNAGGELSVIESLVSTNAVILVAVPSVAPAGNVYSGGPLTAPLQAEIKNYINGWTETKVNGDQEYHPGLGPALGDYGEGWNDAILELGLLVAGGRVVGLQNVVPDAPVGDYQPADYGYPDDAKTRFVTASYVFVKYSS